MIIRPWSPMDSDSALHKPTSAKRQDLTASDQRRELAIFSLLQQIRHKKELRWSAIQLVCHRVLFSNFKDQVSDRLTYNRFPHATTSKYFRFMRLSCSREILNWQWWISNANGYFLNSVHWHNEKHNLETFEWKSKTWGLQSLRQTKKSLYLHDRHRSQTKDAFPYAYR
jgi:hypothetical protein